MPDLPRDIPHDHGFVEIGDRCWVARFESFDVNVGVVAGDRGLLVVDTRASEVEGRVALDFVRRLGLGDVVAVVNTHQHFDHTFGNVVFTEAYDGLPVIAHDAAAEALAATAPALQEFARDRHRRRRRPPTSRPPGSCCPPRRSPRPGWWTSATGSWSWCTPAAGTPPATWSSGSATPTWSTPATSSRSPRSARPCRATATTATRWSGRPPWTW